MNIILTFYIDQNLMAVSAAIHSEQFVTIELLYPFKAITADYYCENGDFLSSENLHKIHEFSAEICKAYRDQIANRQFFLDYVEHAKVAYLTETVEMAIHRFLKLQFESNLNRTFFSSNSYDLLFQSYLHTLDSRRFQSESERLCHPADLQIQNALNAVLDSSVSDVVLFPYTANSPIVNLDLSTEELPAEKLLQALIISSPLFGDAEQGKAIVGRLLAERFNTFTDQKKLKLFMICNAKKELFLYNKYLASWWINRY